MSDRAIDPSPGAPAPSSGSTGSAVEHYERLLAPVYSWMAGPMGDALARSRALLAGAGIGPSDGGLAIDLGAGFGLPSIPLAELGYHVIALDTSTTLLDELRALAGAELHIERVVGDLRGFRSHATRQCAVITCLGDTLTHLEARADVETLFTDAAAVLAPGGQLLLTFRDYTTELEGTARFLPVRSDGDRILTCFLEYGVGHVDVHDLLHERDAAALSPTWTLRVSRYRKLRLAPAWVMAQLTARGFEVREGPRAGGMVTLVARRSGPPQR
jgi:SAM-dependent methyltransferase